MGVGQIIYQFFWKISGEDPQIIKETKRQIKNRFLCSGICVFLLFCLGVVSYHHSFNKLFKTPNLSWLLGTVFTIMIINIYRLNIITLTPKKLKYSFGYFMSLAIRISFIILISLTIVKPLESILLERIVAREVESYKKKEIAGSVNKTALYYDKEIKVVENDLNELNNQIIDGRISESELKKRHLARKLDFLKKDKSFQIKETKRFLNDSPYFIRSIILINQKHPQIWLLTIILILLFLLPFILKFTTPPSGFYNRKRLVLHKGIIEDEYSRFKKEYPKVFYNSIGEHIKIIEKYDDPPFNTILKKERRKIGFEKDFIKYLYGNKES